MGTRKLLGSHAARRLGSGFLAALLGLVAAAAEATPAKIIILRHGEKQDAYKLCPMGQERSLALRDYYLGKGAADSLFPAAGPDGFFAITLHTLELASPAAQSWGLPLQLYSVVPLPNQDKDEQVRQLNQRTQETAREIMENPRWNGKTVVMVWEHNHIADKKLEKQFAPEKVTLRQLLNLDQLPDSAAVPKSWEGDNYDYFWIVEYGAPNSPTPTQFTAQKQEFPAPYQDVPANAWGKPEKPSPPHCKH